MNTERASNTPRILHDMRRALADARRGPGWNNRPNLVQRFEIGRHGLQCTLFVVPFRCWAYRRQDRLAADLCTTRCPDR
jgi:hypothetical protein